LKQLTLSSKIIEKVHYSLKMCLGTLLLVQVDDQYGFSDSQRLM